MRISSTLRPYGVLRASSQFGKGVFFLGGGSLVVLTLKSNIWKVAWKYCRAHYFEHYGWTAFINRIKTRILDWFRIDVLPKHVSISMLRNGFRATVLPKIAPSDSSHTHPVSAAWRSSCMTMCSTFASQIAMKVFSFQASSSDFRDGFEGVRDYHWMKDVTTVARADKCISDHLVVMVDVDYYVDLTKFLIFFDNPIVLYSFQPKSVASCNGEFVFTFNARDEVEYRVSGGAVYTHPVWNFSVDVFTVSHGLTTKAFIVERRAANDHHEYVLLIPIGKWTGLGALFARWLSADPLSHLCVNFGDFNVLDHHNSIELKRSIGRVGDYNSVSLSRARFDAVASIVRHSTVRVGAATMQSWMDNDKMSATVLLDYFTTMGKNDYAPVVYDPSQGVARYQFIGEKLSFDPEAKSLMVPFMSPVWPNTYVPDLTKVNEQRAVDSRVTDPGKEAKTLSGAPSKFLLSCMEEFCELVVPIPHLGVPCDVEEVSKRQNRPSQQQLIHRAANAGDAPVIRECKTFLKAEPYEKPSDPRVITTYNEIDKAEYSLFMYPFADFVSLTHWYSFGKTPRVLSQEVARICQEALFGVVCADANRMDGHVTAVVRILELMLLVRFFSKEYTRRVTEIHGNHHHVAARTKLGVKYQLEDQRGSGGLDTACFNTVLTKFIDYYARRKQGETPRAAYDVRGLAGGDDSIFPDLTPEALIKAAAELGQSYAVDTFLRGEPGVNYLSRFFHRVVWFGGYASTCDLPRALAKLHVTVSIAGMTPLEKLRQKLDGLARTDHDTPIIGEIVQAALRVGLIEFSGEVLYDKRISSWWAQYERSENWFSDCVEDERDYLDRTLPGIDHSVLSKYLKECKTPEDLLKMPALCPPMTKEVALPKATAVVGTR